MAFDITKVLPQIQLSIYDFIQEQPKKNTGSLGDRQKLVYETLSSTFTNGATAKELSVFLHNQGKVMSNERNSVHPRLNELIKLGFVEVSGKKTCQYTDKRVSIYTII